MLPVLTSDVVDGTLRLGHKPGRPWSRTPVRYQVTLASLAGIDLSGAGADHRTRASGGIA